MKNKIILIVMCISMLVIFSACDVSKINTNNEISLENNVLKSKVLDIDLYNLENDYKENYTNFYYDFYEDYQYGLDIDEKYKNIMDVIDNIYGKYLPNLVLGDATSRAELKYSTSSTLTDNTKNNYSVENLNGMSYFSSWVEGKEGYGIGETITVEMSTWNEFAEGSFEAGRYLPEGGHWGKIDEYTSEFNGIFIINGYASSEDLYNKNSRVKKMKLTIDDKEEYILELEDTSKPQIFDVNYEITTKDKAMPIKAKFEILEVYEGTVYQDTALSALLIGTDSSIAVGR